MPLISRGAVASAFAVLLLSMMPTPAIAGDLLHVGRSGYQALPSVFWQQLQRANADGDKVIVIFTADWCTPCKSLKGLLEESPIVQRSVRDLRVLFVDVDEWRGPAHRLIQGAMPSKLPMLARVDGKGQLVQLAMGTEMGLMSEEATAGNFRRLAFGEKPTRPDYLDDKDKKIALARQQVQRRKARNAGVAPLEVEVLERKRLAGGEVRWRLRVLMRNLDSRRRWFVLPGRLGAARPNLFEAAGRETVRFTEHVRATMTHFKGAHDLYVLPLAGNSDAELRGWIVEGAEKESMFDVIELNRFVLNGEAVRFDKKVPYELRIGDAEAVHIPYATDIAVSVELVPKQTHRATLE